MDSPQAGLIQLQTVHYLLESKRNLLSQAPTKDCSAHHLKQKAGSSQTCDSFALLSSPRSLSASASTYPQSWYSEPVQVPLSMAVSKPALSAAHDDQRQMALPNAQLLDWCLYSIDQHLLLICAFGFRASSWSLFHCLSLTLGRCV